MNIRLGLESDIEKIRSVINLSLETKVSQYLSPENIKEIKNYYDFKLISSFKTVYVAEENKEIIGCAGIFKENIAKMLYVVPTITGTKSAIQLFEKVKNHLKGQAYSKMTFEALDSSKNFFQKLNCQIISEQTVQLQNTFFRTYMMECDL